MLTRINQKRSFKRLLPSLMLGVLFLQLFALPAKALAASQINKGVFGPWVKSSVPFDGKVDPMNSTRSEGLNFSCPISPTSVVLLFQTYKEAFSNVGEKFDTPGYKGSAGYLRWVKDTNKRPAITSWIQVADKEEALYKKVMHSNIAGCFSNNPVKQEINLGIKDILDPIGFFTKLIGAIISAPLVFLVNLMEPVVFRSMFTTPHTERGDSVFDSYSQDDKVSTCSGGPCGFQKENLDQVKQQSNFWITLSMTLRSLLSATYGLIVVAVGLIYMYRQNVRSAYNIKKVLPRIIASVSLMLLFPFVLSLIITSGNYFVQSVFGTGPANSMAGLNDVINSVISFKSDVNISGIAFAAGQGGISFIAGANNIVQILISVLILAAISFFMALLFILTIIKQIALIFVVIFAPIAALAYVLEKWAHITAWWFRCVVAIVAIPVVQAIILKVGYSAANSVYGDGDIASKAFAAFILIVMFWLMTKALGWMFRWIGSAPFGIGPQEMHAGAKGAVGGGLQAAGAVGAVAAGGPIGLAAAGAVAGMGSNVRGGKSSIAPRGLAGGAATGATLGAGATAAGTTSVRNKALGAIGTKLRGKKGEIEGGVSAEERVGAMFKGKSKKAVAPQLEEVESGLGTAGRVGAASGISGKGKGETPQDTLRSIDSKMGELTDAVRNQRNEAEAGVQPGPGRNVAVDAGAPAGYASRGSGIIVPQGSVEGPDLSGAAQDPQRPRQRQGVPMPMPGAHANQDWDDSSLGERKVERARSAKNQVSPEPVEGVDTHGTPPPMERQRSAKEDVAPQPQEKLDSRGTPKP